MAVLRGWKMGQQPPKISMTPLNFKKGSKKKNIYCIILQTEILLISQRPCSGCSLVVVTISNICMLCLVDFNSRPLIPLLGSANPFPPPPPVLFQNAFLWLEKLELETCI